MGPFGFGNLGDAAIQEAMLQNIRIFRPKDQIFGFSLNPEDTEARHDIPSYPVGRMAAYGWLGRNVPDQEQPWIYKISAQFREHRNSAVRLAGKLLFSVPSELFSLWRASRNIKGFDSFIVSGGGQLDDYWGGPWYHPYTLFVWALLARLRGVKFQVVSVGAGPLDSPLSRLFVRWALSLAEYRSYRDERSKRFVEQRVGFKRSDFVYPDLAHSLPVKPSETRIDPAGIRKSIVGIGPMAYFDPRVWPEKDQTVYSNYLKKLADFVIWLLQRQYVVRFFPGEADHDRDVIDDLKSLLVDLDVPIDSDQIIDEPIDTLSELMDSLQQTDLVVASRFHGVLLAQRVNKPVVALSYHEKIDMLMEDTGQADYCLQIHNFDVEVLKQKFLKLEANCDEIKAQIYRCEQAYQAALNEQYERIFYGPR